MKIKTADLSGVALDWAVAMCEELTEELTYETKDYLRGDSQMLYFKNKKERICEIYFPSTCWSQGGIIIERENISINTRDTDEDRIASMYDAFAQDWGMYTQGSTFLEAAMRCYVASKLGNEVKVPEELL